jgi:hypothetical protein
MGMIARRLTFSILSSSHIMSIDLEALTGEGGSSTMSASSPSMSVSMLDVEVNRITPRSTVLL